LQIQSRQSFCGINPARQLYVIKGSSVSAAFYQSHSRLLSDLGTVETKVAKKNNIIFILAERLSHIFPQINGIPVKGRSGEITFDHLNAISVFHENHSIVAFAEKPLEGVAAEKHQLDHEMGHQLSCFFQKACGNKFSESMGFISAYNKDLKRLPANIAKHKHRIRKIENFNECIYYLTHKEDRNYAREETLAVIFSILRTQKFNQPHLINTNWIIKNLFPYSAAHIENLIHLFSKK